MGSNGKDLQADLYMRGAQYLASSREISEYVPFPTTIVREQATRGADTSYKSSSRTDQPPLPFVLGTEFAGRIAKNSPIPKGCPYKPGGQSTSSHFRILRLKQAFLTDTFIVPYRSLYRISP
jgi:hypothetical protein